MGENTTEDLKLIIETLHKLPSDLVSHKGPKIQFGSIKYVKIGPKKIQFKTVYQLKLVLFDPIMRTSNS